MPAWLVWLLPLPVATLAALAWTTWVSRTRAPVKPYASLQAHERFRQAMATPLPPTDAARRPKPRSE